MRMTAREPPMPALLMEDLWKVKHCAALLTGIRIPHPV